MTQHISAQSKLKPFLGVYRQIPPKLVAEYLGIIEKCLVGKFAGRVEQIGSTVIGITTDTSDVDMCIVADGPAWGKQKLTSFFGIYLLPAFRAKYDVKDYLMLAHTRIPLLKLELSDGRKLDVSVQSTQDAVKNSLLMARYLTLSSDTRPAELVKIIKLWASRRNLNDSANNEMSTYCWTILAIHFMQQLPEPVLPCLQSKNCGSVTDLDENAWESTNNDSIDILVQNFFSYYSLFDFGRHGVSMTGSGRVQHHLGRTAAGTFRIRRKAACSMPLVCDPITPLFNAAGGMTVRKFIQWRAAVKRAVMLYDIGAEDRLLTETGYDDLELDPYDEESDSSDDESWYTDQ